MTNIRKISKKSFYQLIVIYTLLALFMSISLIGKYSLQLHLLALILAIFGVFIMPKEEVLAGKNSNKNVHYFLLIAAFLIILFFRLIPYTHDSVPLGYDAGIYKKGFESYRDGLPLDSWLQQQPPLLYYLGKVFYTMGFSTNQILIHFFIFFNLLLGFVVYLTAKKFFNEKTGIIAVLLYSVSVVQFKVFEMMYYKNIVALSLLLFSFYFLRSNRYIPFIISASLLGGIHRPTYLICALSFVGYTLGDGIKINLREKSKIKINKSSLNKNILSGTAIILFTSIFYIGRFKTAIFDTAELLLTSLGEKEIAGTFINFFDYQFLSLAYLAFALLGFFMLAKRKQFNILFFWFLFNGIIVYFRLFFFNRYIIMLDLVMIILAASSLYMVIQNKRKLGIFIAILLILSSGIITLNEARSAKPLITQDELSLIMQLNSTEKDAFVMSTHSYYSPWVYGYSNRRTIAPGLFDYDKWNYSKWTLFWTSSNETEAKQILSVYKIPLYIFIGEKQPDYISKFNSSCFKKYAGEDSATIYKYLC